MKGREDQQCEVTNRLHGVANMSDGLSGDDRDWEW